MMNTWDLTIKEENVTYGVEMTSDFEYSFNTWVIENDYTATCGTDSAQNWGKLYTMGWTKKECQQGYKTEWADQIANLIEEYEAELDD